MNDLHHAETTPLTVTGPAPEVSVIVPVYRNAETLRELHRQLCAVLEPAMPSFEIIFVDDACPAGSLPVLEELARGDARVAVLALERNVGQHRAVMTGLAQARGRWTVIMDADLQDPPQAVPRLLASLHNGYAAVFAARRGHFESLPRRITSRALKTVLHVLTGVPAEAGLFVALRRDMVERLLAYNEPRPYVGALIGCTGLPLCAVPVERFERPVGHSAYTTRKRLKAGVQAIAWVVAFKLRRHHNHTLVRDEDRVTVRSYIGARYASPE
jgi:polyisoprenyl-phosphate glycosyltransferase